MTPYWLARSLALGALLPPASHPAYSPAPGPAGAAGMAELRISKSGYSRETWPAMADLEAWVALLGATFTRELKQARALAD